MEENDNDQPNNTGFGPQVQAEMVYFPEEIIPLQVDDKEIEQYFSQLSMNWSWLRAILFEAAIQRFV